MVSPSSPTTGHSVPNPPSTENISIDEKKPAAKTRATNIQRRSVPIDFLRGIAILMVMGRHSSVKPEESGVLEPVFHYWFNFGWSGVDLFFVLSGFLIGGLLFREMKNRHALDLKRFYIRRLFRIWPLYYFYLSLATLLAMKNEHSVVKGFASVWTNWIHLQNYTVFGHVTPLSHTWSLSVEEHFYLVLPLLLFWGLRFNKSSKFLPVMASLILVTCLSLRFLHFLNAENYTDSGFQNPTYLRADSLFFGVLSAYIFYYHEGLFNKLSEYRIWLFLLGIVLVSPMIFLDPDGYFVLTIGYTLLYLGYGLILISILKSSNVKIWSHKIIKGIAYIGFFSYPIYLFHIGFGRRPQDYFLNHFNGNPELRAVLATIIFVVCAVCAGIVLGKLVEKPALAMRDRFFPNHETV